MHISENYPLKSSTKSNASTKISYKSLVIISWHLV